MQALSASTNEPRRVSFAGTGPLSWATGHVSSTLPIITIHADAIGSVVAMTDSRGQVTARYDYDSFGIPQQPHPGGHSYTAREFDSETGLLYLRARYLDPRLGRFVNEDPIRLYGGMNFYQYVLANPTNLIDPSGLQSADLQDEWKASGTKPVACPDCLTRTWRAAQSEFPMLSRAPDYYNLNIELGEGINVSLVNLTIDRYGQGYAGPGASLGFGPPITIICVAGWLDDMEKPDPTRTRNFLQGPSGTAGGFFWVGGQKTRTRGGATATTAGFGTPSAGAGGSVNECQSCPLSQRNP